jgi:hypothetical protein
MIFSRYLQRHLRNQPLPLFKMAPAQSLVHQLEQQLASSSPITVPSQHLGTARELRNLAQLALSPQAL